MTTAKTAWKTRLLSECGEWVSGGTPSKSVASYWNGNIPWISSKSLKTFELSGSEDRISQDAVRDGTKLLPEGAVVFVVRGMSLANEFRVGVTTREVAFNQDLRAIVPKSDMDGRFLARFLRAKERVIMGLTDNASHGTKRLPTELVEAIQVPLPPLHEQRRIAAILDRADAIRRKREEGIRLTEELLRSTFLEMFGDPVINDRNWPQCPLGELLTNIENGWSPKCLDRPVEGNEWGVLKLGAVTYCKYRPIDNKALPPTERHHPEIEVKQGDLLLTRKNTYDLVAACAYVFETPPNLMLPDLIFRLCIKTQDRVLPEFLWGLLTHSGKRKGIQALAGGSAGSMPNISKAKLLGHPIEVPPIEDQRRFADIMHRLHEMEKKRTAQQADQEVLFQALVQRAFRGEL